MATVAQKPLFGWDQIEALGDLKRLRLVLENLPDEPVVSKLEQDRERDRGRDRYPIRLMWNALIAGVVFQHPTAESLLRELRRNAQLRQVCGFELIKGLKAVPNFWAFPRFLANVMRHLEFIEAMYHGLVYGLIELLPDFGASLAIDGTAWQSVKKWFGFVTRLLVDSHYDLPVGFSVTTANASEVVEAHKVLDQLEEQHPQIVERCQEVAATAPTTMGS